VENSPTGRKAHIHKLLSIPAFLIVNLLNIV